MDENITSTGTSSTLNTTSQLTSAYVIGISIFNAIFAVIGTFGNVLVLLAIIKNQCLQTIPDLYIFNLALADLCVTLFRQPMVIYEAQNNFEWHIYADGISTLINVINIGNYATIACLFAVTVDRFLAIQHPFKYQLYCTKKRAIVAIIVCWLIATLIWVIVTLDENGRFLLWLFTFVCLISTVAIYIHLFCIANRQQNRIVAVQPLEQIGGEQQRPGRQTRERKAAKTIALVVGVYIFFYVPFLSYTVSQKNEPHFIKWFYYFLSFLMCNSAVNPYIYCMRNTRYRLAFASILRLKRDVQLDTSGGSVNLA